MFSDDNDYVFDWRLLNAFTEVIKLKDDKKKKEKKILRVPNSRKKANFS